LIDQHKYKQQNPKECPIFVSPLCAGEFLARAWWIFWSNAIGYCDQVCWGHHENNVGTDALMQRLYQNKLVWINSHLPDLNDKLGVDVLDHVILSVSAAAAAAAAADGKERQIQVAWIGLYWPKIHPSLCRPRAFGGATIPPVLEAAAKRTSRETFATRSKYRFDILPHDATLRDDARSKDSQRILARAFHFSWVAAMTTNRF
jgi:hypothetical protein